MSLPPDTAPEPQRFGDFEIVRELGRGGMGVVYEARQISLNRRVALKVMNGGIAVSRRAVDRFRREAEAAARLHHTNIVPIYTFGEQDGVPFYAMELIEGPSLDRLLKQSRSGTSALTADAVGATAIYPNPAATTPPPNGPISATGLSNSDHESFDQVARMIADVADALDHAHQQGVIHRDIKPSNLLMSPSGKLSVNDFGLARILEQPGVTMTGEFVGTPAYMSPEQITAGRLPIDARTDIYSLGATLYEMLTQERPFPGERREQILAQILHKEPRRPRRINKNIPVDLETICLKALEKDPDRRYQTAAAMAEDLRRYVQRFAISARRVGPIGQTIKWARRHPAVAIATVLVVLLAAATGFFYHQSQQRDRELRSALREKSLSEALTASRSGDLEGARRAIEDAERADAPLATLEFLRGYLAFNNSEHTKAIEHLSKSTELDPSSLSAKALLLMAHYHSGHMDYFYPHINDLNKLQARTPEDLLFHGQVASVTDPVKGMAMLSESIRQKDTLLARLVRADIGDMLAQDNGSITDVERALTDLATARNLLPSNRALVSATMWTNLTAAGIYEQTGLKDKQARALADAKLAADALEDDGGDSRRNRFIYLEFVGDEDAILREFAKRRPEDLNYFSMKVCLHTLIRRKRFADAIDLLDRTHGNEMIQNVERGIVAINLPDGLKRCREAFDRATAVKASFRGRFYPPYLLLLSGKPDEARPLYRAIVDDDKGLMDISGTVHTRWNASRVAFHAGLITERDLEETARSSRLYQCEGQFGIAMQRLAAGDRAGAKVAFQRAVDTRIISFLEHRWSKTFLRLMEDESWPKWIDPR